MIKLIVLEGLDSSGKSSQIKLMKEKFESDGKSVKHIHFPMYGYSEYSDMISKFLRGEYGENDEVDPKIVANMYAMDRYMYKNQLLKDLKEFDIIIMDRYVASNIAYQGAKTKNKSELFNMINGIINFEFNFLELPYPDITIFFDVPIKEIENRLNNERLGNDREYLNGKQDIHEKDIDFQNNVRSVYILLEKFIENFIIINAYKGEEILSPENLFNDYKKYLNIN